jgi:hypothetical protein
MDDELMVKMVIIMDDEMMVKMVIIIILFYDYGAGYDVDGDYYG